MTRESISGIILSFAGILLIFLASPNVDIPLEDRLVGNSLIMFGAFAYAIYVIVMRQYVLDSGQLSPLSLIAWVSLIGWFFFIPFVLVETPSSASSRLTL